MNAINTRTSHDGRGRLTIQSAAIMGIFVTTMKWPRTVDPAIRKRTIHAVLTDSKADFQYPLKLRSRLAKTRIRTRNVPTLPASVGVKNPFNMPAITRTNMRMTHATSGTDLMRTAHEDFGPLGPRAGFILHHP